METWRYFDITHAQHDVLNPSSIGRLEALGEAVGVADGHRVLDLGCGHGTLLVRWRERFGITGIGVDASPYHAERAKQHVAASGHSGAIEIVHGQGEDFRSEERFDVAACVGASWIFGGHAGTLRALDEFTRPGGAVVVGEPYWIERPPAAYLELESLDEDDFLDLGGCLQTALDQGLELIWMARSTPAEWDRYEMKQAAAVDAFARDHPNDPDLADLRARRRQNDRAYVRWGHRCLGWALWAFRTQASEGT